MCTVKLNDELIKRVEKTLNGSISIAQWLEMQIELWLQQQSAPKKRRRKYHSRGLTDEELERELAECEPFTDDDFPDLSKEDYEKLCSRNTIMSNDLKKWF